MSESLAKSLSFFSGAHRRRRRCDPGVASKLESLPDELLYQIFDIISPEQCAFLEFRKETCFWDYKGPKELLNLVSCSRRLYQIGISYLYNTFTQGDPSQWVPYMRTLFASPGLATHVQNLKMSSRRYYQRSIDNRDIASAENIELMHYYLESRTIDDQIQALSMCGDISGPASSSQNSKSLDNRHNHLSAVETLNRIPTTDSAPSTKISLVERIKWRSSRRSSSRASSKAPIPSTGLPTSHDAEQIALNVIVDDWRAVLTYLIYRLPYLHSLTIEEDQYMPRSNDLEAVVQRALSPSSISIPRLQSLSIIYTRRENTSKLATYWPLLLQPSLRSLTARKIREYGWMPEPRDLILPLTHLSFSQSNLSSSSIDSFLRCCPFLTYLYYEHVQSWEEQPFNPQMFGNSIRHFKGTLRKLTLLRPELQYDLPTTRENEFTLLGSVLVDFKVLENLEVTAHLLLGPQKEEQSKWYVASLRHSCTTSKLRSCVPASLLNLKLRDAGEDAMQEVRELASVKKDVVPKIKKVQVLLLTTMSTTSALNYHARIHHDEDEESLTWEHVETVNGVIIEGYWRTGGIV